MLKNLIFIMVTFGTSFSSFANDWSYSLGWSPLFVNMVDRVSVSSDRKTGFMGTSHTYVFQAALNYELNSKSSMEPFLATSLLPRKDVSGNIEENLLLLGVRYARQIGSGSSDRWLWNLGTGIWRSTIKGKGGTYIDPNGADFYLPGRAVSTQMVFTSLGLRHRRKSFETGPEIFMLDFLHNQKRSYNLMLQFSWRGGE